MVVSYPFGGGPYQHPGGTLRYLRGFPMRDVPSYIGELDMVGHAPKQPTTQVRQPDSPDTKTIRTNDPVTNREEERLANEALAEEDHIAEEQQKQQEEEAKRAQEEFQTKQDSLKAILESPEGFVLREEGNTEGLDLALADGSIYYANVQSGKGGLDVEERAFLSKHGYDQLRTAFGPSMGKK